MIENRALLVQLTISQWYNRSVDRNLTKEIGERYDVKTDKDYYVKILLPKQAMKQIDLVVHRLRYFHYRYTLPWQDGNIRIIPSNKLFDYQQGIADLKSQFENAVEAFLTEYPNWIEIAKQEKKGLFDPKQYPSVEELRDMFNVKITFFPFPHVDDFRLEALSSEQIEEIKKQTQQEIINTLSGIEKHLKDQIYKKLHHFCSVLVLDKPFRSSSVSSVIDAISTVRDLNVTQNKEIDVLCQTVFDMLSDIDADRVREDAAYRIEVYNQIVPLIKDSGE